MVESKRFLFGIPNTISRLYSSKLYLYGWLTVIVGVASLANAAIATATQGVKSYFIIHYVNTHWITSVFVISGGTTVLVERLHIDFFLFAAISFNLISLLTSVGATIFDCANLHTISKLSTGNADDLVSTDRVRTGAIIAYNIVDIICCSLASALSVLTLLEIRAISKRYFANLHGFQSRVLLCLGFCLCIVGAAKQVLWICELGWLVRLGETARFVFLNYTMDEPVWNCIYCLTGLLTIWTAWKGGRAAAYCALPLTALSAYPAIQYLWIDYRWMLATQLSEVMIETPKPDRILQANTAITCFHLMIIVGTVVQLCWLFAKHGLPWTTQTLTLDSDVRKAVLLIGLLLLLAGTAFLATDILNLQAITFYRLFYPTEQKLPFFLIPGGILCIALLRNHSVGPYFIPCLLIILLLILHSTIFHILTYIYLARKVYFGAHICDLFFYSKTKCTSRVETVGAVAHFMEALLAVMVTALSLYGSLLFGRMLSLYACPQADQLSTGEEHCKKRHTNILRFSICVQLTMGMVAFLVCTMVNEGPLGHEHPLFAIHGTIQRVTFSLLLIIFPVVQLLLSNDLHKYPVKNIAQLSISCVRITDILMQVDYRNVTHSGIGWTVITGVELVSLFLHFSNFVQCGILLDLGFNRLPTFEFSEETQLPSPQSMTSLETTIPDTITGSTNGMKGTNSGRLEETNSHEQELGGLPSNLFS